MPDEEEWTENGKPILVAYTTRQFVIGVILLLIICLGMFGLGHVNSYNRGWNDCAEKNNFIIEEKP